MYRYIMWQNKPLVSLFMQIKFSRLKSPELSALGLSTIYTPHVQTCGFEPVTLLTNLGYEPLIGIILNMDITQS